jgi:hypothetical protein
VRVAKRYVPDSFAGGYDHGSCGRLPAVATAGTNPGHVRDRFSFLKPHIVFHYGMRVCPLV